MIKNEVIVLTGASSGIGRATARLLAGKEAKLILISRRKKELQEVQNNLLEKYSQEVNTVIGDISNEEDIDRLARKTLDLYGRIDVWINNASLIAYGSFEKIPFRVVRKLIEVNVLGTMYASHKALMIFKKQGKGTLINISSIVGTIPMPFATPYPASKFAIRGFTESLYYENKHNKNINIVNILPSTMDTPIYRRAANYSGKVVKPIPPVYHPQKAAKAIVSAIEKPRKEIKVGIGGKLLSIIHRLFPSLTEMIFVKYLKSKQYGDKEAKNTDGNVFDPKVDKYDVTGNYRD